MYSDYQPPLIGVDMTRGLLLERKQLAMRRRAEERIAEWKRGLEAKKEAKRKRRERSAMARRKYQKSWTQSMREMVMEKFSGRCVAKDCMWVNADGSRGCTDRRCLQINHVNGGGYAERRKLSGNAYYGHVLDAPYGVYQLLCANCNWIKRHVNKDKESGGGQRKRRSLKTWSMRASSKSRSCVASLRDGADLT